MASSPEATAPAGARRRRRRRIWPWLLLLAAGVALWAAFALVSVSRARSDLNAGRAAVERARGLTDPADLADARPLPTLRDANDRFSDARRRLDHPVLRPARVLPVVGRQLRSATALSKAAERITGIGVTAVEEAQAALELPRQSGAERLALVRRLASLADRAERGLAGVDLGPRRGLLPPLADAYNELLDELLDVRVGLRRAATGADAVAGLLDGPRRYLVFAANNAEMRGGSGMFLLVGELRTAGGALELGDMDSVIDVDVPRDQAPPLPPDLADRWGWLDPNVEWRNLMLSPRFDANARLAAQMWEAAGRGAVDGVLAIDPLLMEAILGATGPVEVGGREINAENVREEVLHAQYLRFEARGARQEEMGELARRVFDALNAGTWDPATLASGLASAARGRHVMAWSPHATEQAGWEVAGIDGRLEADSMLLSILNRGGTKLDYFLRTTAALELVPDGDRRQATVTVDVRNAVGPGEPPTVAGPNTESPTPAGRYTGIVALSLPGDARNGRIDGVDSLAVVGADGPTRVVGAQVTIDRGEASRLVFRFDLPRTGSLRVEPSARVPAVRWEWGKRRWRDDRGMTVAW